MTNACHQLLDYIATHPSTGLWYHACDMILAVHTDASYLSKAGGKSRAGGHFYLTNRNNKNFNNGAVLTLSAIIYNTKNYTSYSILTYSIVLVQTRSHFPMPCSKHSKIAFILTLQSNDPLHPFNTI
jgi:hypothetical protein